MQIPADARHNRVVDPVQSDALQTSDATSPKRLNSPDNLELADIERAIVDEILASTIEQRRRANEELGSVRNKEYAEARKSTNEAKPSEYAPGTLDFLRLARQREARPQ